MPHFTYKLSAFQVSPTKKNPWLSYACRPVTMTLVECDKFVRHPVKLTAPILFECGADGIVEADQKFLAATEINPSRRPDIGCSIT